MTSPLNALSGRWARLSFGGRLAAILGAGLLARLGWALAVPVMPVSDSIVYWMTAENLALHGVYGVSPDEPFSYWPVGASAVYALMFKLFGVGAAPVVLVNLIAGCLLIHTSALLARRWLGEAAALWTAAALAAWPTLILYTTVMASEVFFALAVNLGLLSWRIRGAPLLVSGAVSGLIFGAAALIRPAALLIPIVYAGLTALRERRVLPQGSMLAAALAAMALVIAPWSLRNLDVHGEFVLISTNGGPVMWMGNNPESTGVYMPLPDYAKDMSEVERAHVLQAEAKAFMLNNPGRATALFFRKVIDTHIRETIGVHWNEEGIVKTLGPGALTPLKLLTQGYWMLVLSLSLAGAGLVVIRGLTENPTLLGKATALAAPPLVIWGYYAGVHGIILAQDRYHLQSAPFIAMLAAAAVLGLASLAQRAPRPMAAAAGKKGKS